MNPFQPLFPKMLHHTLGVHSFAVTSQMNLTLDLVGMFLVACPSRPVSSMTSFSGLVPATLLFLLPGWHLLILKGSVPASPSLKAFSDLLCLAVELHVPCDGSLIGHLSKAELHVPEFTFCFHSLFPLKFLPRVSHEEESWEVWRKATVILQLVLMLLMCWLASLVRSIWPGIWSALAHPPECPWLLGQMCVFTSLPKVPKAEATRTDRGFSPSLNANVQCLWLLACPWSLQFYIHFPCPTVWSVDVKFQHQMQKNLTELLNLLPQLCKVNPCTN